MQQHLTNTSLEVSNFRLLVCENHKGIRHRSVSFLRAPRHADSQAMLSVVWLRNTVAICGCCSAVKFTDYNPELLTPLIAFTREWNLTVLHVVSSTLSGHPKSWMAQPRSVAYEFPWSKLWPVGNWRWEGESKYFIPFFLFPRDNSNHVAT